MTYIKINENLYPTISITGELPDTTWDRRNSKTITLNMDYTTAINLFTHGITWSIVLINQVKLPKRDENGELVLDENGVVIYETQEQVNEYDNSTYCVAGPITDNRDGTISVKMGELTALEEAYAMMLGEN